MNRTIAFGKRDISYELNRKKVKNVNLRIRADCSVYVSANDLVSIDEIERFLQEREDYILTALDKYAEIAKYAKTSHSYVTGESLRYLGKDLRLVVNRGENEVSSDGVSLFLSVLNISDTSLKGKLIGEWYDTRCQEVLTDIASSTHMIFQKYNIQMPKLVLRDMSTRWGSCQPSKGTITLNKSLIRVSRIAIEYVVMHEFVHFLHPNHSKKFYEMLSTLMPDWKGRKKLLETTAFYAH